MTHQRRGIAASRLPRREGHVQRHRRPHHIQPAAVARHVPDLRLIVGCDNVDQRAAALDHLACRHRQHGGDARAGEAPQFGRVGAQARGGLELRPENGLAPGPLDFHPRAGIAGRLGGWHHEAAGVAHVDQARVDAQALSVDHDRIGRGGSAWANGLDETVADEDRARFDRRSGRGDDARAGDGVDVRSLGAADEDGGDDERGGEKDGRRVSLVHESLVTAGPSSTSLSPGKPRPTASNTARRATGACSPGRRPGR